MTFKDFLRRTQYSNNIVNGCVLHLGDERSTNISAIEN